jgi:hypothetical protein
MTEISDMELPSESETTDYTPYIGPPISTSEKAQHYSSTVEPLLITAFDSLNIDYFFTLTMLHIPTIDMQDLIGPLIVIFTSSAENIQAIKLQVESLWSEHSFTEYMVSVSLGKYTQSIGGPVASGPSATKIYHDHWNGGISIGYLD